MILKILFAHCLGDYLFQTNYLASNKGNDNYLLFIHSVLYTLATALIFTNEINYLGYIIILVTHIIVDYLKARGFTVKKFGNSKALLIDQVIHYVTLLLVLLF